MTGRKDKRKLSPSSRRAWIEIDCRTGGKPKGHVALLAEGVDRNWQRLTADGGPPASPSSRRAWIEINSDLPTCEDATASPSSRRAWIEIGFLARCLRHQSVALLAEGVDRNRPCVTVGVIDADVALLAEGVDRNILPLWL